MRDREQDRHHACARDERETRQPDEDHREDTGNRHAVPGLRDERAVVDEHRSVAASRQSVLLRGDHTRLGRDVAACGSRRQAAVYEQRNRVRRRGVVRPEVKRLAQRVGQPKLIVDGRAAERRRDADDANRLAVDPEYAADRGWAAAECGAPQVVADDGDGRARLTVVPLEHAARDRPDRPIHLEEAARDKRAGRGARAIGERELHVLPSRDRGQ